MSFYTEVIVTTRCAVCKEPLDGSANWALHKRKHMLERLTSTPEGRYIYESLKQCGKIDRPDDHLSSRRQS